jgi:DNA-binding SARP family transcriptional activator
LVLTTGLWIAVETPSDAGITQQSSIDQINEEFTLQVTNPADGVTLPSTVFVKDARLSTTSFAGDSMPASMGGIYLSFGTATSPAQDEYGQVNSGHFFSTMTPLAPTAITFTSRAGRRYVAKESNPANQTNNPNASSDNGLLDATYWFLVPITTRSGVISIGPTTTEGVEFHGFVGQATTPLHIDGPISFRVAFPRKLTGRVTISYKRSALPLASPKLQAASFTSLNEVLSIVSLLFCGLVLWQIQKRFRRRVKYVPVYYPPANAQPPAPSPEPVEIRRPSPNVTSKPQSDAPVNHLRVNVLGALEINPSTKGASDPIRSVIAYLALHDDRPQSGDEIQSALWPESMKVSSVSQKTFLNYVSRARQTVGAQYLPEAGGRSGYQLINTSSDWREFRTLATNANSSAKEQAVELRQRALKLVRGVPFEGESSTFFEWAVSQKYVTGMIETVTNVAHQLQADLVMIDDLDGATWAVRQAMLLAPTEMPLWRDLVDICHARGDQTAITRFWQDAERALWPAAIKELQARLVG